jgi:DNA-binding transcriptional LysR family regulator
MSDFTHEQTSAERQASWDDLRVVLAVSRAGSLSGAARALKLSHPTVFRRVRQIEARIGVRLFDRARAGYALTPAGDEMVAVASRLAGEVDALERRLAGRDLRPSGTVRLTTTDTLLFGPLAWLLAAFREAHPAITLEVAALNAMLSLSKREADVAIRPSSTAPESLVGRRLAGIAAAVYRGATAPAELGPSGLAGADWVAPDDSLSDLPLARWLADRGYDRRATLRANSLLALRDAARAGIGLALLPCYVGDADPGLTRVGAPIAELESALWLLTHPDLRRVARIRAVVDGMAALLQPLRPLFEGRQPRAGA